MSAYIEPSFSWNYFVRIIWFNNMGPTDWWHYNYIHFQDDETEVQRGLRNLLNFFGIKGAKIQTQAACLQTPCS